MAFNAKQRLINKCFAHYFLLFSNEYTLLQLGLRGKFENQSGNFLYDSSSLPRREAEIVQAVDVLINELKLRGLCSTDYCLPVLRGAGMLFFDEKERNYADCGHVLDPELNKKLAISSEKAPMVIAEVRAFSDHIACYSTDPLAQEQMPEVGRLLEKEHQLVKATRPYVTSIFTPSDMDLPKSPQGPKV